MLTAAIEGDNLELAERLDIYYDRIMSCRVTVEALPKRSLYNVHIDMSVPGVELVVKLDPNTDLYVSIRDSFHDARRKLEDFARRQRGDVKHHEGSPHARISSLFPDKVHGFLTIPDVREIYFHEHSVLNRKFKQLEIGVEVRFAEEMGEKGPQASSVTVV